MRKFIIIVLVILLHQPSLKVFIGGIKGQSVSISDYPGKSLAIKLLKHGKQHSNNGDYDSALFIFEKSKQLFIKNVDYSNLAKCLNEITTLYIQLEITLKAQPYAEDALRLCRKQFGENNLNTALAYYNIGMIKYLNRNYETAREYFILAIASQKRNGNKPDQLLIETSSRLGRTLWYLRKEKMALSYLQEALRLSSLLNDTLKDVVYNDLGWFWFQTNRDTARYYHQKAIEIREKLSPTRRNRLNLAQSFNGMATAQPIDDYEKTLLYNKKALSIRKHYWKHHPDLNISLNTVSSLYYHHYMFDSALHYSQESLIANSILFNDRNIYANPEAEDFLLDSEFLISLDQKAKNLAAKYAFQSRNIKDLQASISTYELLLNVYFQTNKRFVNEGDDSRCPVAAFLYEICQQLMSEYYLLYKHTLDSIALEKVFIFAEMSKTSMMRSHFLKIKADQISGLSKELIARMKVLEDDFARITLDLLIEYNRSVPDQKKILELEKERNRIKTGQDIMISYLKKRFPKYFQLRYDKSLPDIKSIQEKLLQDQAILEFAFSNPCLPGTFPELYTFLITKESFFVKKLQFDDTIAYKIDLFRSSIINKKTVREFSEIASCLYDTLIRHFEGKIKAKRLIIIPDGPLYYFPFECLLTKIPDHENQSYLILPYLIREYSIDYAPSVSTLVNTRHKREKVGRNLLAMAPITFSSNPPINRKDSSLSLDSAYVELTTTREEVKAIGNIIEGRIITGENATKQKFIDLAGKYRILHLATHGIINDDEPMLSKLAFSRNKDHQNAPDLYMGELYMLDLHADIAVLSACNMGTGPFQRGEGIMSMARGFQYAGVPSIVMSLWDVNAGTNTRLMKSFYQYLKEEFPKDIALQRAKLEYLRLSDQIQAHPWFWAGFICLGDPSPVELVKQRNFGWLVLLIPVGLISLWWIRKKG